MMSANNSLGSIGLISVGEYEQTVAVFQKVKNEADQVSSTAFMEYFTSLGIPEKIVANATQQIDVNNNCNLSFPEIGTKIKLVNQLINKDLEALMNQKISPRSRGSSLSKHNSLGDTPLANALEPLNASNNSTELQNNAKTNENETKNSTQIQQPPFEVETPIRRRKPPPETKIITSPSYLSAPNKFVETDKEQDSEKETEVEEQQNVIKYPRTPKTAVPPGTFNINFSEVLDYTRVKMLESTENVDRRSVDNMDNWEEKLTEDDFSALLSNNKENGNTKDNSVTVVVPEPAPESALEQKTEPAHAEPEPEPKPVPVPVPVPVSVSSESEADEERKRTKKKLSSKPVVVLSPKNSLENRALKKDSSDMEDAERSTFKVKRTRANKHGEHVRSKGAEPLKPMSGCQHSCQEHAPHSLQSEISPKSTGENDLSDRLNIKIFETPKDERPPANLFTSAEVPRPPKEHNPMGTNLSIFSPNFVASLINSPSALIKRGYTVVKLPRDVVNLHTTYLGELKAFKESQTEFSQKAGPELKIPFNEDTAQQRFVMRLCGKGTSFSTPRAAKNEQGKDIGTVGMQLYERADQFCRNLVKKCLEEVQIPPTKLEVLLDPINQIGTATRSPFDPSLCYSSYVPDGYLSSSILETSLAVTPNSSSSKVDGGLVTVAIASDVPGLEVLDQELNQWIPIEQLIHEHATQVNKYYRQFAVVYWGKSASYLRGAPGFQQCEYREHNTGEKERYSLKFKQRSSPLTTPCHSPNDQLLLDAQLSSITHTKPTEEQFTNYFSSFLPAKKQIDQVTTSIASLLPPSIKQHLDQIATSYTNYIPSNNTLLVGGAFLVGAVVGNKLRRK